MNKEVFLKELQTRIRVLADSEQQDILGEYAQHIDLQISEGSSEEEAIQDFGGLDQLAAEILEAYHVNPTFAEKPALPKGIRVVNIPDPRPAFHRGWAAVAGFFCRMGSRIQRTFLAWGCWIKTLFHKRPRVEKPEKPKKERLPMENMHPFRAVGAAMRRFGGWLGRVLRMLAWLAWNLFLLLAAAPVAALGVLGLLCTGTILVLLVQGYPLVGVTLCCIGLVLCSATALILGAGLRWRRQGRDGQPPCPPADTVTVTDALPAAPETTDLEVYHA